MLGKNHSRSRPMFSVDAILSQHFPRLNLPGPARRALKWLLRERDFQQFAAQYPHLKGLDFVEQALCQLDFDYHVSEAQLENIPAEGRVILVANHPIGSLDGLALLRLLGRIRPDVKIVANRLLASLPPPAIPAAAGRQPGGQDRSQGHTRHGGASGQGGRHHHIPGR